MITIVITTVYSRDLRYKETMMKLMMKLPDDMCRQELLQYLTVIDIVNLDNACMNHKYRSQLLDKINGVILQGDKNKYMKDSLFKWLGMRRIYWIDMMIVASESYLDMKNRYVDQFRYTKHLVMRGYEDIRDDMAIFIISHCPCLLSIIIGDNFRPTPKITDHTLKSIAEHCTGLQSLSLRHCREITDTGLIAISEHCPNLKSLKVENSSQITDTSIMSISTHCTGLQELDLEDCLRITDDSIISMSIHSTGLQSLHLKYCDITDACMISISTHCTGLQSLHLQGSNEITDDSIISISSHCTGLQSLHLQGINQITDDSIISISTHCTGLKSLHLQGSNQITDDSIIIISNHCPGLRSLNLYGCPLITDASIIPISEYCTVLQRLDVSDSNITDASLIAIAKNCTEIQSLRTYQCKGLSRSKLRGEFKSVSELRAVLLSIYPSLPPSDLTNISSCTIH